MSGIPIGTFGLANRVSAHIANDKLEIASTLKDNYAVPKTMERKRSHTHTGVEALKIRSELIGETYADDIKRERSFTTNELTPPVMPAKASSLSSFFSSLSISSLSNQSLSSQSLSNSSLENSTLSETPPGNHGNMGNSGCLSGGHTPNLIRKTWLSNWGAK